MISLIVAMTPQHVIGKDNAMPWHLPADLKHFKTITTGKPVIMGRKTFESIGQALPNRRNIVISRNPHAKAPGCEVVTSLDAALGLVFEAPEICIIGGGQIFREALPLADRLYVTFIDFEVEGDATFPEWDPAQWVEISHEIHEPDQRNAHQLTFITLDRIV